MSSPPQALLDAARQCPDPHLVLTGLERLAEAGARLEGPDLAQTLLPLLANSGFLTQWLVRHPEGVQWLDDAEVLFSPLTAEQLEGWYREALTPFGDEGTEDADAVMVALRHMKFRAFLHITARDVALDRPITETCAELTLLSEVACEQALAVARALVSAAHGPALDPEGQIIPFVIVGMGKLGGDELNYSSDIDLIYFYGTDEGSAGELTVHQHFKRVCELLTRLLGEPTAEGFVFRVDLRLRPEGRSGPLCNSLASAVRYYESWGRLWERMAWLRARPIAGDLQLGDTLLEQLEPWIYRRTLDYGQLEKIRALKGEIQQQRRAARTLGIAKGVDLKLDRGGIRAVEFSANALQLIHGGRTPGLRDQSTLGALNRLWAAGLLTAEDHDTLAEAYLMFRRVEHRVQMQEERQTHRLPTGDGLPRLARRLGYTGDTPGQALADDLDARRDAVSTIFEGILGQRGEAEAVDDQEDALIQRARIVLSPSAEPSVQKDILSEAGFADPAQGLHLLGIAGRRPQSPFSRRASAERQRLGRRLMTALLGAAEPERALTHLTALLGTLGPHGFYLNLLEAHPRAARQLVEILSASDFVGQAFARHPSLLEIMVEARPVGDPSAELRAAIVRGPALDDPEARLEHLARARQSQLVTIAIGDLGGALSPDEVEQALTGLAEETLKGALEVAAHMLAQRYGTPDSGWCVLGLGKLGGSEMSYGSDLDLIFVYERKGMTDGPRPLTHQEWFTRLVKRTVSLLSMPTVAGQLYEVDTRLRPGGNQGTLVSRLERLVAHHTDHAGTWERMALVRARPVAGTETFCDAVQRALLDLTYGRPAPEDLWREMARLRRRMELEIAREDAARYNAKVGRGGLVDLEFIAQGLQITHGAEHAAVRTPNTRHAIHTLGQLGLLPEAEGLLTAHGFLRRLTHRMRIVRARSSSELRTEAVALDRLARRLGYRRNPLAVDDEAPGQALLNDYTATTDFVRRRFDERFGTGER
ncbi:MAG: bifunctional [glutamate--ammonia ligase]-adenylyl-L-tyrosine phosphorylase/[glutamate--ammonia-ligase] adenylyltransferase [Bradymonadia bacterium]